jgi:hypothetical protein
MRAPLASARYPAGIALFMVIGWSVDTLIIVASVLQDRFVSFYSERLFYVAPGWMFLWAVQLHLGARVPGAAAHRFRDEETGASFSVFAWAMPILYLLFGVPGFLIQLLGRSQPIGFELALASSAVMPGGFIILGFWYLALNRRLRRAMSSLSSRRRR